MFWLLLACKQPDPAPRDLDQVFHDTWSHYAAQDEDALVVDVRDLRTLVRAGDLAADGTFSDITADEVAEADVEVAADPATARGLYTIGPIGCTPDEMERILEAPNQDELFEGNYTAYDRTYTSSEDAYFARDTHHLTWDTDYAVDVPIFGSYSTSIHGGMHFAPDGDDGPYLFSRTVMPNPADGEPDTIVFDLDFQIEVYYPEDGGITHLFAMWRHIDVGAGFDTENDGAVGLILDGLHDYDDDTTAICDEGRI